MSHQTLHFSFSYSVLGALWHIQIGKQASVAELDEFKPQPA